jgi:dephospho-CoA kinase
LLSQPAIQEAIGRLIGPDFVSGGQVSRRRLGARVFNDPVAMAQLNRITHGPLGVLAATELSRLAEGGEHELAVFEAAVYFLLPSPPPVDLVVAVMAPVELRALRLQSRSGGTLSAAAVAERIAAQADLDNQWQRADEIIVNDGTLDELETRTLLLLPDPRTGRENLL